MTPESILKISVIIPVINEVERLQAAVLHAWASGVDEVVVADGGSTDGSIEIAESENCILVRSLPGRGPQQNAGARSSSGDVLVFLHADSRLEPGACQQIRDQFVSESLETCCGCFRQRIDHAGKIYRMIEKGNEVRVRLRSLFYGDQGIFISRQLFDTVGGFPNEPLMEDFVLAQRVKSLTKPVILPGPIHVDSRRWKKNGPIRQTIRNWWLVTRFYMGASPAQLSKSYARHDGE